MRGALGLGTPVEASRFLLAAGLLSLLTTAAERSPVLVLVDDLQWVDQASAQALLFAAPVRADKVGVIMTVRSGEPLPVRIDGLPRSTLAGLDQEATRTLLAVRAPDVDTSVADGLHTATGGNPLALVEVVRTLTPSQRAGRSAARAAALHRRHRGCIRGAGGPGRERPGARCWCLPPPAMMSWVRSNRHWPTSAARSPTSNRPWTPGWSVTMERGRLGWRHPLVRSAVYYGAPAADRAAAHRAVADRLPEGEPSWAWHRAAAADGPDEQIAAALDTVATDASRRAGFAAAARAAEHAAGLSARPQDAARRRLTAADAAWLAGDAARAEGLLDEALASANQDDLRGRVLHLARPYRGIRPAMFGAPLTCSPPQRRCSSATTRSPPPTPWLIPHLPAGGTPILTACLPPPRAACAGCGASAPSSYAEFFTGLAAMFTGHNREGAALIQRVIAAEPPNRQDASGGPRGVQRLAGLGWLGRCGEGHDLGIRRMRALRAQGALGMLPRLLRMTASQDLDDDGGRMP